MVRLILILLIILMIARIFVIMGSNSSIEKNGPSPGKGEAKTRKGVPKELGEYIEFEETGKRG
jgi:hypothetical protein